MEVNYLAEIIAFERWLETNYLPISSQLLWYKMMNLYNRSGWSEWVIVDNLRLMAAMQMGREATLIKARDELIKAGRIIYQKGKKGSPNRYKLVLFTCKSVVQRVVESEVKSVVESEVFPIVQSVDIYKQKQNIKKDTNVSKEPAETIPYQEIADLYNAVCKSFPRLTKLSETRKKAIKARMKTYEVKDFTRLFELAESSDFLKGKNNRNWWATFDWLIADGNMAKVLDGNYANKSGGQNPTGPKPNAFHNFPQRETDYEAMAMERLKERMRGTQEEKKE